MRAKEFLREAQPALADVLKAAISSAKPKTPTTPSNPNQIGSGQGSQGGTGPQSATQAGAQQTPAGGTQTQQNGVAQTPSTSGTQQQQQPGVLGSFISGMTGGKASSLGSLAKLGGSSVAQGAGLGSVANQLDKSRWDAEAGKGQLPPGVDAKTAATTLKPGTELDVPQLGKIKVNKVTPQGIELDTSKAPTIGVRNMTVDLKSLAKK